VKKQHVAQLTLLSALLALCGCSSLPPGGEALAARPAQVQQPIRPGFAAQDTAAQADGRIVVFGLSGRDYVFARYLEGGQLDPSFGAAGEVRLPRASQSGPAEVLRLTVQGDGKVLALGGQTLLRLLPGGQPDPDFGQGGRVTAGLPAAPQALASLPDGRVLVAGGSGELAAPASTLVLARLMPDGQPDLTFGSGGQVRTALDDAASAFSLWPLANGGALVGGVAVSLNEGTYSRWVVARYTAGGVLDRAFGDTGVTTVREDRFDAGRPSDLAVDAAGRVLVAGSLSSGVCTLARLLPSGERDPGWAYENVSDLRVLPDGNAPDSNGGADNAPGVSLALLPSGMALGGCAQFAPDTSGKEQARPVLARLDTDGGVNLTFGSEGFQDVPDSARIEATPQGKLLVGLDPVTQLEP
jgi:uncharacterized delta-60 repeat protein